MSAKPRKPARPSGGEPGTPSGGVQHPEVVGAATAFERELGRFEALARAACRDPLDSRKNIERAAEATREAAGHQEQTVLPLQELAAAMGRARDRFQASAEALAARALEIQARMAELAPLFERFQAVQQAAAEINDRVVKVSAGGAVSAQGAPAGPAATRQIAAELDDIGGRMEALVEQTRALGQDAQTARLPDLAREAEALRQKVLAARQKLKRVRTSLASLG